MRKPGNPGLVEDPEQLDNKYENVGSIQFTGERRRPRHETVLQAKTRRRSATPKGERLDGDPSLYDLSEQFEAIKVERENTPRGRGSNDSRSQSPSRL